MWLEKAAKEFAGSRPGLLRSFRGIPGCKIRYGVVCLDFQEFEECGESCSRVIEKFFAIYDENPVSIEVGEVVINLLLVEPTPYVRSVIGYGGSVGRQSSGRREKPDLLFHRCVEQFRIEAVFGGVEVVGDGSLGRVTKQEDQFHVRTKVVDSLCG